MSNAFNPVHLAVLSAIPRAPKRISKTELWKTANLIAGEEFGRRAMDRMMITLTETWGLQCLSDSTPYQYSWPEKAPELELPPMNVFTALTVILAGEHLSQLLPPVAMKVIEPRIQRAKAVLAKETNTKVAKWQSKIRVMSRGLAMSPPVVQRAIIQAVYEGLLDGQRLQVTYGSRMKGETWTRELSPLGIIARASQIYLVVYSQERERPYTLALQRIQGCKVLKRDAISPPGFDLDAYLAEGNPSMVRSRVRVKLKAQLAKDIVKGFEEQSLGKDQKLEIAKDGSAILTVTLPDTLDTVGFLKGYGSMMTVLEPEALRLELLEDARKLVEQLEAAGGAKSGRRRAG
jgi:predicted DNA-binding transcriptional regulator YafY